MFANTGFSSMLAAPGVSGVSGNSGCRRTNHTVNKVTDKLKRSEDCSMTSYASPEDGVRFSTKEPEY